MKTTNFFYCLIAILSIVSCNEYDITTKPDESEISFEEEIKIETLNGNNYNIDLALRSNSGKGPVGSGDDDPPCNEGCIYMPIFPWINSETFPLQDGELVEINPDFITCNPCPWPDFVNIQLVDLSTFETVFTIDTNVDVFDLIGGYDWVVPCDFSEMYTGNYDFIFEDVSGTYPPNIAGLGSWNFVGNENLTEGTITYGGRLGTVTRDLTTTNLILFDTAEVSISHPDPNVVLSFENFNDIEIISQEGNTITFNVPTALSYNLDYFGSFDIIAQDPDGCDFTWTVYFAQCAFC